MALEVSFRRLKQFLAISLAATAVWLFCTRYVRTDADRIGRDLLEVRLSFAVPLTQSSLKNHLSVQSEAGGPAAGVSAIRNSLFSWTVRIKEKPEMRGLRYDLSLCHAPSVIPYLSIAKKLEIVKPVEPTLLEVHPAENVPSAGPVLFRFDTPIDGSTLERGISLSRKGTFTPVKDSYWTAWSFYPLSGFKNSSAYSIRITERVLSKYGMPLSRDYKIDIRTAPRLGIYRIYPAPGSSKVWLSRAIRVEFDNPIRECIIRLRGEEGETELEERAATFIPDRILTPGTDYKVSLLAISKHGERLTQSFSFVTTDIGTSQWAEVKLLSGNKARVTIREGKKILYSIIGEASDNSELLPVGTLYVDNSGKDWIRLNADILIHSLDPMPRRHSPGDHGIQGLPKTYGCIVLSPADMKKLSDTLPKKAMVIVHR